MSKTITVRADFRDTIINLSEITRIEALADYVIIRTKTDKIVTVSTMKGILSRLPEKFIRTHRSHIVNSAKIKSANYKAVILPGKVVVPVGRAFWKELRDKLRTAA